MQISLVALNFLPSVGVVISGGLCNCLGRLGILGAELTRNQKFEVWWAKKKKKGKESVCVCVCVCVCVLGSWWLGDLTTGKQNKSLSLWNQRRLLGISLWLEPMGVSVSQ